VNQWHLFYVDTVYSCFSAVTEPYVYLQINDGTCVIFQRTGCWHSLSRCLPTHRQKMSSCRLATVPCLRNSVEWSALSYDWSPTTRLSLAHTTWTLFHPLWQDQQPRVANSAARTQPPMTGSPAAATENGRQFLALGFNTSYTV